MNELITIEDQTKAWELMQRKAVAYSRSSLVPVQYRSQTEKKEGYNTIMVENSSAEANCIIAIDIAQRMRANELMVMQNLSIIQGRPSWSSQWIIAMINGCGRFSPLRFELKKLGEKEVTYIEYSWDGKKQAPVQKKINIVDMECIAWATEKETGQKLESSVISIEIAVKEGWYTKTGSKWQTMPEVMLRYRAASFFGKIYAPELLMGLQSVEESQDITDLSSKYPDAIPIVNCDNDRPTSFIPENSNENVVNGVDQETGEITEEAQTKTMEEQMNSMPDAKEIAKQQKELLGERNYESE